VKWDEEGLHVFSVRPVTVQLQVHDARKPSDPTTRIRIRRGDGVEAADVQSFGVVGGGGRRIWKFLLPRYQVLFDVEHDFGEKVLSSARDPRFGDKATILECIRVVVQEVDYGIEDFLWEGRVRHRGSQHVRFGAGFVAAIRSPGTSTNRK